MPLLAKYDLHILEICKSADALSKELARYWLSEYMLKVSQEADAISDIVDFLSDYDTHKSHGRSISRKTANSIGLNVKCSEDVVEGLDELLTSLYVQYEFFLEKTPFVKLFENGKGVNWGKQQNQNTPQPHSLGGQSRPHEEPKRTGAV